MTEKSYLHLCDESTWGELPGSPTYYHVPVLDYKVEQTVENRSNEPYCGVDHQTDQEILRGHPAGQLSAHLYGWEPTGSTISAAQKLFEWGFGDITASAPRSKVCEWADGANAWNVRDLGMRCNSAEITGSDDGAEIQIVLDLMGRERIGQGDEEHVALFEDEDPLPTAQTVPTARNKLANYLFHHATLALTALNDLSGSKTEILMQNFKLGYKRNLKPHWLNGRSTLTDKPVLGSLNGRKKEGTFSFTPLKVDATWDALRRTPGRHEFAASLVLKGVHQGTGPSGTWDILTIPINRLSLIKADSDEKRDDDPFQPIEFAALKPESSSQWITPAWTNA